MKICDLFELLFFDILKNIAYAHDFLVVQSNWIFAVCVKEFVLVQRKIILLIYLLCNNGHSIFSLSFATLLAIWIMRPAHICTFA